MKLKHLFKDSAGRYYFQKRWPQDLLPAMRVAGRGTNEKRRLDVSDNPSEIELAKALNEAREQHNHYVEVLRASNVPEIEAMELRKKALVWLDQHGLQPGCWQHASNEPIPDAAHYALEDIFSDAYAYDRKKQEGGLSEDPSLKARVQALAFRIATQPVERTRTTIRFSDAWQPYLSSRPTPKEKRQERARQKEQARWDEFLLCAGDREFSQENVTEALLKYAKHLATRRKTNGDTLTPESRRRYMTPVKAALTMLAEDHMLPIQVKAPRIRTTADEKRRKADRYTFDFSEQQTLIRLAGDESDEDYAAWSELFILIAIQTGAIASELQRMRPDHLSFADTPVIYFEGELKTLERRRVVPLVVKPERIQLLTEKVSANSEYLLGDEVSAWDESKISRHLSKIVKRANSKAVPYSLRHSFTYSMDMRGIPAETQALFGGWEHRNINKNHRAYGRSGLEHQERLEQLATICKRAFAHLIDDGEGRGNVILLEGRKA